AGQEPRLSLTETRVADPRKLILATATELRGADAELRATVELIGKFRGLLRPETAIQINLDAPQIRALVEHVSPAPRLWAPERVELFAESLRLLDSDPVKARALLESATPDAIPASGSVR